MFGYVYDKIRGKQKRSAKKREAQRRDEELRQDLARADDPTQYADDYGRLQQAAFQQQQSLDPMKQERREQFRGMAREDVTEDLPGLSPEAQRAYRESAQANIDAQVANQQRQMASMSGRAGMRGGAAMALQQAASQQGMQAMNQFERDMIERDSEVALQRLAAYMASLEGYTAEDLLDRQMIMDYMSGRRSEGREDAYSKRFGSDYWRA